MDESAAIAYTVSSFEPNTHRVHFSLAVRGLEGPSFDLVLPVWAPGAYQIRDSAREVRDLTALAPGEEGRLPVDRVAKNRWRISTGGRRSVEVRYTVYAHDDGDDGFDATESHLFLNATRCFPWVDGRQGEPVEIAVHLPPAWKAFAELPRIAEQPVRFRARNYEELVDSPIDCGQPVELDIRPAGIPHRLLLCGGPGNYEAHRLEQDVRRVVEEQIRYFGDSPLGSYTFFVHLMDRRDGGLEHKHSTSLGVERSSFRPEEGHLAFLALVSHEYFHLYNVKRIRPKVLGPFDLDRENYTRMLWWMEGTTDYLAYLLLRRANLYTPKKYLGKLAEQALAYRNIPGRDAKSLEEASFDAWIDLYQRYEETRNQSVSYYLKGHLVSACLDLEIRQRTGNARSIDDVFRKLWSDFGKVGRGLEEGELYRVIESATGLELGEFFDRYTRGLAELDLGNFTLHAGLKLAPAPKPPDALDEPEPGYLGIDTAVESGRLTVKVVLDQTPARRAGLSPGDEIVALDGLRLPPDGLDKAMKRYPPGSPIALDIFRRGVLRRIEATTGAPPPTKLEFTPVPKPTELQRTIYEGWLATPWPAEPRSAAGATEPEPRAGTALRP